MCVSPRQACTPVEPSEWCVGLEAVLSMYPYTGKLGARWREEEVQRAAESKRLVCGPQASVNPPR